MSEINKTKIEEYLKNARPLDLALYDFHFREGRAEAVLGELAKFQNADGGFGNAIEPDLRLPESTALATTVAFQFITAVNADPEHDLVKRGLAYFQKTYNPKLPGWDIIQAEVDAHPHAPWWEYKVAMKHFGWGNPSAEILAYLIKYKDSVEDQSIIHTLTDKALGRIKEVASSDFHEILNFKVLHSFAGAKLKEELAKPLAQLITKAVNVNPEEWKSYCATPMTFIKGLDDPFASLFDKKVMDASLQHLEETIVDGNHWEPTWDWGGKYPSDWEKAKQEWSGQITLKNLVALKKFA